MLQRQRVPRKPTVLEVKPISKGDLARMPEKRQENGIVQKLRSHHHRIARLDAQGCKDPDITEICAISHQRLYTLRASPAYQELVSQYRNQVNEAFAQAQDEFARASMSNMMRAELQIEDHLDEAEQAGELVPLKTLLAITADRADRFGYPKGTIVGKVNMGNQLEAAMRRSGRTIVVDAKGAPALAPTAEGGSGHGDATSPVDRARSLTTRRGF